MHNEDPLGSIFEAFNQRELRPNGESSGDRTASLLLFPGTGLRANSPINTEAKGSKAALRDVKVAR